MRLHIKVWNVLMIVVLLAGAVFVTPARPVQAANALRISQVYGGGGNSGATYRNDFIEIYNSGSTAINLTGWSVQYASTTGAFSSSLLTALSGTIQPGHYYLIQEASGGSVGSLLPASDASGIINMSASAGKVALVNSTIALSGNCPTGGGIVDFLGFGPLTDCYESTPTSANLNSSTAAIRNSNGCIDTDNNRSDFTNGTPNPRNSATAAYTCAADLAPTVSSTTPANGATGVALAADITINFSEAVNVTYPWFSISCTLRGAHTAAVSGVPTSFTLNPAADFVNDETCTVTVTAASVSDQDAIDPPDTMAADYTFSFSTPTLS